jgi:uncharacterized protein YebE (UPF0316 family)
MSLDWSLIPAALFPLVILVIRIGNLSISTLRVLTVVRGRKRAAWALGFVQSLLWVTVIAGVLENLDNPWNLAAYAAGFATGNVLGIIIDNRIAPGHSLLRITSSSHGAAIMETLHQAGMGATEVAGSGRASSRHGRNGGRRFRPRRHRQSDLLLLAPAQGAKDKRTRASARPPGFFDAAASATDRGRLASLTPFSGGIRMG